MMLKSHAQPARSLQIDAMKRIGILLVVTGHAIQSSVTGFDNDIVFRIIYSFHMPLFMFLAGYVLWNREPVSASLWLLKRFRSLVVPFFAWYLATYLITPVHSTLDFPAYMQRLFRHPDYGLWFLWILFLNYAVFSLVRASQKLIGTFPAIAVVPLLQFVPGDVLGTGLLKWHSLFFFAGYTVAQYRAGLKPHEPWLLSLSLILFPFVSTTWHRTSDPFFMAALKDLLHSSEFSLAGSAVRYAYLAAVPFIGITALYALVKELAHFRRTCSLLAWTGTMTFDIYVSHQFLLVPVIGAGIPSVFLRALSVLALSLGLSIFLLRKVRIVSILFLGGRSGDPLDSFLRSTRIGSPPAPEYKSH